jgi:type II secretory pathway component GspD/PulD (secretin)
MRGKSWPAVFEWLSDISGMPVVGASNPSGTFSFIPPATGKKYSLEEIVTILNESLFEQRRFLRREKSRFVLGLASIAPVAVTPELLASRRTKELVTVFVPHGPDSSLQISGPAGTVRRLVKLVQEIDSKEQTAGETFAYKCQFVRAGDAMRFLRELLPDSRPASGLGGKKKVPALALAADERTNTIFVVGPAEAIAKARNLLKQYDTPVRGQPPMATGTPILRTYTVPGGSAEPLAKLLQDVFRNSTTTRILPLANNQIMVYAGPEEQLEIARLLQPAATTTVELVPLSSFDGERVVATLTGMFGSPSQGGPFLEYNSQKRVLIVRGSADQIIDVKTALRQLEGSAQAKGVRVFTLDHGSAATMAEMLLELLPRMRSNPVKMVIPATGLSRAEKPKVIAAGKKDGKPGKADVWILLTAFGNQLIVTTDDPEAMATVAELVRLFQTPVVDGDFHVIRLKNAQATGVARVLDEVFNGPPQPRGGFGPAKGSGPAMPRAERVRIVADPITNSLLIRASQMDLFTIRNLLTQALDIPGAGDQPDRPSGGQPAPEEKKE